MGLAYLTQQESLAPSPMARAIALEVIGNTTEFPS